MQLTQQLRKVSPLIRMAPFYMALASIVAMYLFIVSLPFMNQPEVSAYTAPIVSVKHISAKHQNIITGTPLRLEVPRFSMNLAINDGIYDSKTNSWSLSDTAVQYALVTTKPNNISGNTVIYGHNAPAVLAPLENITVGDVVSITTTNGHTFNYTYSHDRIVDPSFTEVLSENPDKPQLTLLTCEGIWSKVRRLMYFDFQNVT